MNDFFFSFSMFGLIFLLGIGLGITGTLGYQDWSNTRLINGFYLQNSTESYKDLYEQKSDPRGDWVAINVKGMQFQEGYKTCVHECSHHAFSEIWAEQCEKNLEGCVIKLNGMEDK